MSMRGLKGTQTTTQTTSERTYGGVNRPVMSLIAADHGVILDLGCGDGSHARALPDRIVDGVTLSHDEEHRASTVCRHVVVHNLEQGLPSSFSGPYDLCLCSHVLEHLANPGPVLKGILRVLKPGGELLVALPNVMQYHHRLNLLRGRFNYTDGGIMDSTHVRWYTWETGRKLLESHGYVVKRQIADGGFPLAKLRRILPAGTVEALDQFALRRFPGLCGWQHIYLAQAA